MTCSRDEIAAVEKTKKKRVPCFGFNKVSYNARYTNIRGAKKASFPGFGPFDVSGIHLGLLGLWNALYIVCLYFVCFWLESACDAQNFFQFQRPAFCTAVWVRHTHHQRSMMLCDGVRFVIPQVRLRIRLCPWSGTPLSHERGFIGLQFILLFLHHHGCFLLHFHCPSARKYPPGSLPARHLQRLP